MNLGFNEGKRGRRGGWEKGKEKGPPRRGRAEAPPLCWLQPQSRGWLPPTQVPEPRRPGTHPQSHTPTSLNSWVFQPRAGPRGGWHPKPTSLKGGLGRRMGASHPHFRLGA